MGRDTESSKTSKTPFRAAVVILILAICALPIFAGQDQPLAQDNQQATEQAPPPETANAPESEYRPLPRTFTLRAGTIVTIRTSQFLSSDQSHPGDTFSAELQQPVIVDGWVVARRGQTVLGRVAVAKKAGRIKGVSQLGLELTNLVLVDGQQLPIHSQLMQTSAGTSKARDAGAIGTTTGVGAAIGAAANGGAGAGIGAGIGAAAGLVGVLLTRGRNTVIPAETQLTFQLTTPVSFSTARSAPAFRPVEQADYGNGTLQRRPEHFAVAPPAPYYPYYWGYGPWGYPGPIFFGGYYRFGRGYGRGFGRGFGHGHFHR
jgi:hypothetical protein